MCGLRLEGPDGDIDCEAERTAGMGEVIGRELGEGEALAGAKFGVESVSRPKGR